MKIKYNPRISLGMPVLNGERHISYALEGIFKQTFKNFNLIIYDNASTDKTLSICEKFQKKYNNIMIYKHKKRVDVTANWISVLKKASCKYFLFCAHDDVFKEKEYLRNLINKVSKNIIPFGTVNLINEKNYLISHICNNKTYNYNGSTIYRRLKFFITPSIFGKNCITYGIHERKYILKILELFNKTKYLKYNYGDNYLNYKILEEKKVSPVINATLLKRIKKDEEIVNFFGAKKNKLKILLDQFQILLTYTKFSNFLEIILIIILIPIYIFYERIALLVFNINNKKKSNKKNVLAN